jgi:hypothetical protein
MMAHYMLTHYIIEPGAGLVSLLSPLRAQLTNPGLKETTTKELAEVGITIGRNTFNKQHQIYSTQYETDIQRNMN